MPTYIMLMKMTQAGLEKVRDTPERVERARNIFKSVGGEQKEIYFTFGRYDMIAVVEAPSDEAMGKAVLMIAHFGTVSIETLKAFPDEEGLTIIKGLP